MKINKTRSLLLAALLVSPYSTHAAGDPQAGETKAAACAGCHGPDGNSPSADFPKIAGQGAAYIEKQLQDYKAGRRSNPIMLGMVAGLSEQDMADLAAYYAAQEPIASPTESDLLEEGKGLYMGGDTHKGIAACMACHGPSAAGNPMAKFPMLAGQHAAYSEKTLKEFRDGARANDPNEMMRRVAEDMSDRQIAAVSAYLSGVGGPAPAQTQAAAPAPAEPAPAAAEPAPSAKSGQQVVDTACAACHVAGVAGAPKLGDKDAWAARADKGLDTLVANSINGIGAMPPKGGQMSLTDEEMRAAVITMLEQAGISP